jgi:threonine dehydrogenase-like Zn-dependent dehydrogenase
MVRRIMAAAGGVVIRDDILPPLGPGDVRVRARYSVISPGTERSIVRATAVSVQAAHEYPHPGYEWPQVRSDWVSGQRRLPRQPPPDAASLGYSLAGIVEQTGDDVLDLRAGDRVACSGSQCAYHAEQVIVPRSLVVPVPDSVELADAAHVTLGAIAFEAFRRTGCTVGETLVVIGTGLLGLLITQIANRAGVYVVAVDADPARRDLADRSGALLSVSAAGDAAVAQVRGATGGFGADAVIVAAADPGSELVNFGFAALRQGGRVVALGDFGMDIDRQLFFRAQATFVPSIAYGPGRYDPVYEENNVDLPIGVVRWTENRNMALFIRMLAEGHIGLALLPRAELPFADATQAYERLLGSAEIVTAVFRYDRAG